MAPIRFRPVRSEASENNIVLRDASGERLFIDMPNAAGAAFIALAIQNELTAAKRGT